MTHGAHHPVPHDKQCACCFEDLSNSNYAEYLPYPHEENNNHPLWTPSPYCADCIEHLLRTQWSIYTEALAKTTCKAEQRRLLTRGPPINLRDDRALPCPANGEVHKLWYHHGNTEKDAKLEYSLVGEVSQQHVYFILILSSFPSQSQERDSYWKEQMQFYCLDENDEEEEKDESKSNKK